MALNENAIIDADYFDQMWNGSAIDETQLENYINGISSAFEKFCNRPLVERSFTYVESEAEAEGVYYHPEWCIFDAPPKTVFWFPTYPVSTVSYFEISGTEISASTGYTADTGYMFYTRTGKLVYSYGYDFPYMQNVKTKWTGGYSDTSPELAHLRMLLFMSLRDVLNAPQNMTFESEKIGQYSYKTVPTYFLKDLQGLSPKVYADLSKYRREAIG